MTITWKIEAAGKIDADIAVTKDDEFPDLPRFGVRMFLDKKLSAARYFGMGPQESYCDKHQAASHGLYQANVDDLHEDYIRPQENGSHYDCEHVELNNSRYGIVVSAENAFSFNASYYTQEELEKKTHNYELTESDSVVFCVDYALNGIGSNSCGPVVLDQYRFDDVLFRFQFTLIPLSLIHIYALPDGERAELIDGHMYMMAPPSRKHQRISTRLVSIIDRYIEEHKGKCEVYAAPFAVYLDERSNTYVEPDISVICDPDKLDDRGCKGAPDWIIEIVSPASKKMDYLLKLLKYRFAGVKEYWIVDPEKNRVIVYNFTGDESVNDYTLQDFVKVGIYEDFVIDFGSMEL